MITMILRKKSFIERMRDYFIKPKTPRKFYNITFSEAKKTEV